MSPRVWRIGGVAAAVLVLVVAWLLVISPTMQKAAARPKRASKEELSELPEIEIAIFILVKVPVKKRVGNSEK